MIIDRVDHNKIIIGEPQKGYISSTSVVANLLYAILEKLEEIRINQIDIENTNSKILKKL